LRIRTQTVLLSLVPLFFLCLLFVLAFVIVNKTVGVATWSQHSAQVVTQNAEVTNALGVMSQAIGNIATAHKASAKRAALARYHRALATFPSQLRKLQDLTAQEPPQRLPMAAYKRDMNVGLVLLAEYLRLVQAHQMQRVKALGTQPYVTKLSNDLTRDFAAINDTQYRLLQARQDQSRRSQQVFGVALLLCCVLGIALTLLAAFAYGLRVVRRLHDLAANAQRMASGEAPLPIGGSDEIAELNVAYLQMTRRMQKEHQIAASLQRALLPSSMPVVDGLRIDTAYLPATLDTEVGGDWYDVFMLSETCVGISVGDVAGHGLKAASVMGTTRQAIRTAAGIEPEPGLVLAHVNRALIRDERDFVVTSFFGTLNLVDGTLRYAIAGHPSPLIVRADRSIEQMDATGLILGVDAGAAFETREVTLEPGSGIVLYTDGIIEVERDYFKGVHDLEATVGEIYHGAAENIAEAIQQRIFARVQPRDDSAVLVVRLLHLSRQATPPRVWTFDSRTPLSARRVKHEVVAVVKAGTADADVAGVELILGELLSNVARHTPGMAEVTLEWKGDVPLLHVRDNGKPFEVKATTQPDLLAESGRGLFLCTAISSGITVERTRAGNHVTAVLPMLIPAAIYAGGGV